MPTYIQKVDRQTLPTVCMRGVVAFPSIPISFEVSRDFSEAAIRAATSSDMMIFLLPQKNIGAEEPELEDMCTVGTVAKIKKTIKAGDGVTRVIAEGLCRATVLNFVRGEDYFRCDVLAKTASYQDHPGVRGEALMAEALRELEHVVSVIPSASDELMYAARSLNNPGLLADFIASSVLVKPDNKMKILGIFDPLDRLETIIYLLHEERDFLLLEMDIHSKVRARLDENQREYYLREQLKVISDELGADGAGEAEDYYLKIAAADLPDEVREKLNKECARLSHMASSSPDGAVIRNYLDVCLDIPWKKSTKDRNDIARAKKILDEDHSGLDKIKDRILDFLSVRQMNPDIKGQILCFFGPPGTGKTSLAASIARAMNRKYVRVSLGGVRDEADIRGHRKTYIGSMPGRIIDAVSKAGVNNPLILLDEIDKMCADVHGDPASAMLEVLDVEQNKSFRDHYVELPFDLSDCFFITTANSLDTIPRPLLDRMEIIDLHTYTRLQKLTIAKEHLVKKQMKNHGLTGRSFRVTDKALLEVIDYYTRESGVRNLEREIGTLCRKSVRRMVENPKIKRITVEASDVEAFLGKRRYIPDLVETGTESEIGVVNGLAYTESGGDLLKIEVAIMEGTGKLELTGTLGDVMKESAHIAVSYIRAHASELGVPADFYKKYDIHIHFPEGAVPKDGPSAGVTITSALTSALSGRGARCDTAMTGEITLTGRVIPIGGLREKSTAAYASGMRRVLIPYENLKDMDEVDPEVKENIDFIPCKKIDDVLREILMPVSECICMDAIENAALRMNNVSEEHPSVIPDAVSGTYTGTTA